MDCICWRVGAVPLRATGQARMESPWRVPAGATPAAPLLVPLASPGAAICSNTARRGDDAERRSPPWDARCDVNVISKRRTFRNRSSYHAPDPGDGNALRTGNPTIDRVFTHHSDWSNSARRGIIREKQCYDCESLPEKFLHEREYALAHSRECLCPKAAPESTVTVLAAHG